MLVQDCYRFLTEDGQQEKLVPLVWNYVFLGESELAAAALQLLHKQSSEKAEEIIKSIISLRPPIQW